MGKDRAGPRRPPWWGPFRRAWRRAAGPAAGRAVLAVSGGPDSVALLRATHALAGPLGLQLTLAHLDHGVRGEVAEADSRFVAELAGSLGLPCVIGRWSPTRAGHFEADARRARYDWLAGVAADRGATIVATGHTRDDQAETVLHRAARGTGLRGLGGMATRRPLAGGVDLVRPLLGAGRDDLRAYLEGLGQPWRVDATNADRSRTRSRLRLDVLPALADACNPRAAEALARLALLARNAESALDRYCAILEHSAILEGDAPAFDREALVRLAPFERAELLRRAWRRAGWPEAGMDARRWRRLARWAVDPVGATFDVGAGVAARVDGSALRLVRSVAAEAVPAPTPVPLPVPGAVSWADGRRIVATLDPGADRDETIDADALVGTLIVRGPTPGDRFDPLGMGGRRQSLADFFRGRGVPRGERGAWPIVCDDRGIVWVVGQRLADRVRLGPGTTRPIGLRDEGPCD